MLRLIEPETAALSIAYWRSVAEDGFSMWWWWHGSVNVGNPSEGWAAWLTAGGTIALALAASVALLSLRDARRTRHRMLVSEFGRRWESPLLAASMERWAAIDEREILELADKVYVSRTATSKEHDDFTTLVAAPGLLEELGVLEDEGVLDANVIYKVWGATIIAPWKEWEPSVRLLREHTHPWSPNTSRSWRRRREIVRRRACVRRGRRLNANLSLKPLPLPYRPRGRAVKTLSRYGWSSRSSWLRRPGRGRTGCAGKSGGEGGAFT